MHLPRGRWAPVAFLLLLSPTIAELMWGTTTVGNIGGLLIQIGMYGGGAVIVREVAHRWGGGVPTLLVLGAAYATIEEALVEPLWFTPQILDHPYGVALGVFWPYVAWNLGYHAVFSISVPILLTELAFPAWHDRRWLGRTGLSVMAAVFVANTAGMAVLWYTVLQQTAFHVPARTHPTQQATAAVVIVVLAIVAWRIAGVRISRPGGGSTPARVRLAVPAAIGAALWFGLLRLAVSAVHLRWLPFALPLAAAGAVVVSLVLLVRRWSNGTDVQLLAACTGALVVQMAAGFFLTGLSKPSDVVGKAVLNVLAVLLLAWCWARLVRRHRDRAAAEENRITSPGG